MPESASGFLSKLSLADFGLKIREERKEVTRYRPFFYGKGALHKGGTARDRRTRGEPGNGGSAENRQETGLATSGMILWHNERGGLSATLLVLGGGEGGGMENRGKKGHLSYEPTRLSYERHEEGNSRQGMGCNLLIFSQEVGGREKGGTRKGECQDRSYHRAGTWTSRS